MASVPRTVDQRTVLKVAVPAPFATALDYLCPAGWETVPVPGTRVRVPLGVRQVCGVVVDTAATSDLEPGRIKPAQLILDGDTPALAPEVLALCLWAARYYHAPLGEVIQQALPVRLREPVEWDPRPRVLRLTPTGLALEGLTRAPRQHEALQLFQQHPRGLPMAVVLHLGLQRTAVKALLDKGLLVEATEALVPLSLDPEALLAEPVLPAMDAQRSAIQTLTSALDHYQAFLLLGVTGSGKTEVYLQVIQQCLQRGRQALVLVPEIGLTPQTIERFRRRFRVPVAVLHSGLSDGDRLDGWQQAYSGHARIVIGTRSAILAPLPALGLIVVDEEHDASFKQQDGFRYNARDLTLMRAHSAGVPVLMGSATPSLESLALVAQGRMQLLPLRQRAGGGVPPHLQCVDIRDRPLRDGLADISQQAITDTLRHGGQVLVFVNRRGYAPVLYCQQCGWIAGCRQCDARSTLHAADQRLVCHHCGASGRVPSHCPACQSTDLRPLGAGTERLHESLQQLLATQADLAQVPVLRIDRDNVRNLQQLEQVLALVHQGRPAVLVGTQMLAKGHHFPSLDLVVVVDGDAGFASADPRGPERNAQLLVQVAGRAGRAGRTGRVLIQTRWPDNPLLVSLLQQGYEPFAAQLQQQRQLQGLPPARHAALLRVDAAQAGQAMAALDVLVQQVSADTLVELWGPSPALMERKAGRYRAQLLLLSDVRSALHGWLDRATLLIAQNDDLRRLRFSIDVDPLELL